VRFVIKRRERINRVALKDASSEKIENGRKVRVDSTASESNIHKPSDSSLLYDSIRVMGRLLENCQSTWGFIKYHNHTKQAKQLARKIIYAKKASQKEDHYQKLLAKDKDMAKSEWVYQQLKNFRAGIESNISCLKRVFDIRTLYLERIFSF